MKYRERASQQQLWWNGPLGDGNYGITAYRKGTAGNCVLRGGGVICLFNDNNSGNIKEPRTRARKAHALTSVLCASLSTYKPAAVYPWQAGALL